MVHWECMQLASSVKRLCLIGLDWLTSCSLIDRLSAAFSSTRSSSCASTTRTSVCSSSSATTCSCSSRRSTRRKASSGPSSTSAWIFRTPLTLLKRSGIYLIEKVRYLPHGKGLVFTSWKRPGIYLMEKVRYLPH